MTRRILPTALLIVFTGPVSCSDSAFEPRVRQLVEEDQVMAGPWTREVFSPLAARYGPSGLLYVLDHTGSVDRLTPDGVLVDSWSPDGYQETINAFDTGTDGTIFGLRYYVNSVVVMDTDWTVLRTWDLPGEGRYDDIVVMGSGVYVLENGQAVIRAYSTAGESRGSWPISVPSTSVHSIAAGPSGELLLLSWSGAFRYSTEGEWLGTHVVRDPLDACSPDGRTLHIGLQDGTVRTFFTDGSPSRTWGDDADGNPVMIQASAVTAGASGDLQVVDRVLRRINRFAADGTFLGSWNRDLPANGEIRTIGPAVQGPGGDFHVMDRWFSRILRYDASGDFVSAWGERGLGRGAWYDASDFTVDGAGRTFILETRRIQRFGATGELEKAWSTAGSSIGIAADSEGNLYVTEFAKITKHAPDGELLAEFEGMGRPEGIAVDGSDRIFVVDRIGRDVRILDTDGNLIDSWPLQVLGNRIDLDIAVDGVGNVYVLDPGRATIEIHTGSGKFLAAWTTPPPPPGSYPRFSPVSIGVDASDRIMITDAQEREVVLYRKLPGAGLD